MHSHQRVGTDGVTEVRVQGVPATMPAGYGKKHPGKLLDASPNSLGPRGERAENNLLGIELSTLAR